MPNDLKANEERHLASCAMLALTDAASALERFKSIFKFLADPLAYQRTKVFDQWIVGVKEQALAFVLAANQASLAQLAQLSADVGLRKTRLFHQSLNIAGRGSQLADQLQARWFTQQPKKSADFDELFWTRC